MQAPTDPRAKKKSGPPPTKPKTQTKEKSDETAKDVKSGHKRKKKADRGGTNEKTKKSGETQENRQRHNDEFPSAPRVGMKRKENKVPNAQQT